MIAKSKHLYEGQNPTAKKVLDTWHEYLTETKAITTAALDELTAQQQERTYTVEELKPMYITRNSLEATLTAANHFLHRGGRLRRLQTARRKLDSTFNFLEDVIDGLENELTLMSLEKGTDPRATLRKLYIYKAKLEKLSRFEQKFEEVSEYFFSLKEAEALETREKEEEWSVYDL